jgi:RNA polymerase sigma-70 factor, ECF subfamily
VNETSITSTKGEFTENAHDTSEAELVQALIRRDRKATEEFVQRYSDPVYSYLHRRLFPHTDQVEDCFQQVFLAAWQSFGSYRGEQGLKFWLIGIARHKVQDIFRERLRLIQWEEDEEPSEYGSALPDELALRTQIQDKVWEILHKLPERYRMLLIWRYWEHQSGEEMALQIGKTPKSVERGLSRAREWFRRQWESEVQNG